MFIDDKSELGLAFSYDHVSFGDTFKERAAATRGGSGSDFSTGFIGGEYNYHLNGSAHGRALPYVGAHLGTTFGDGPSTASYGLQAGIKYFLTKNVAFKPEFRWTHFDQSGPGNDDTRLTFGFAYFLPK